MGFISSASGEGDLAEKWLRGKMWLGREGADQGQAVRGAVRVRQHNRARE